MKECFFVIFVFLYFDIALSHSWLDCLDTDYEFIRTISVDTNATKCRGQIYDYSARVSGNRVDEENTNKFTMSELNSETLSPCYGKTNFTKQYWQHTLNVIPGQMVHYAYISNGHLFKDRMGWNTKQSIYWTKSPDTILSSMASLNDDNLVEDSVKPFDDRECGEKVMWTSTNGQTYVNNYRPRAYNNMPCLSNFTVPTTASVGVHHFVWKWIMFNPMPEYKSLTAQFLGNQDGYTGSAYTSCFSLNVLNENESNLAGTSMTTIDNSKPDFGNQETVNPAESEKNSNSYYGSNSDNPSTNDYDDPKIMCSFDFTCEIIKSNNNTNIKDNYMSNNETSDANELEYSSIFEVELSTRDFIILNTIYLILFYIA